MLRLRLKRSNFSVYAGVIGHKRLAKAKLHHLSLNREIVDTTVRANVTAEVYFWFINQIFPCHTNIWRPPLEPRPFSPRFKGHSSPMYRLFKWDEGNRHFVVCTCFRINVWTQPYVPPCYVGPLRCFVSLPWGTPTPTAQWIFVITIGKRFLVSNWSHRASSKLQGISLEKVNWGLLPLLSPGNLVPFLSEVKRNLISPIGEPCKHHICLREINPSLRDGDKWHLFFKWRNPAVGLRFTWHYQIW
jgi:hypothetical protein